jgi:hypothetical protein
MKLMREVFALEKKTYHYQQISMFEALADITDFVPSRLNTKVLLGLMHMDLSTTQ